MGPCVWATEIQLQYLIASSVALYLAAKLVHLDSGTSRENALYIYKIFLLGVLKDIITKVNLIWICQADL